MSVRIVSARSGKGFEYDIRFTWPEGGRLRERGKCPTTGKDASRRWGEQREAVIRNAGKSAYAPLHAPPAPSGMTLADFWPRVVRDHYEANRKKPSTIDAAKTIFRLHLAPLHSTSLDQITTADVAALKGRLAAKDPKTVNNVLSILSRALRCAVDWEVISALPCRFGLLKVADGERDWYELADYRRLVDAAQPAAVRLLVLLAGSAGMRRGEIIALKWADVDIARKQVRIERAMWRRLEGTTKGGRYRVVPLTPELVAALGRQRLTTGLRERVLYSQRDEELSNRTIRNWLAQAQRRASLEANGGIHILRHTFCSHLAVAGVPAKAIQELAGHADLKTTMRYMHLSPANRSDAMATLARFYASDAPARAVETG